MNSIQYAWAIYFAGALGCTIAAWWMFLWAWRFIRYAAVVTVMAILFTPYAIDPQTMTMAPALYSLVFDVMGHDVEAARPIIKLMVGIWLIALILAAVLAILTRGSGKRHEHEPDDEPRRQHRRGAPGPRYGNQQRMDYQSRDNRVSSRGLSRDEQQARNELLRGEVPIRAIRD